MSGESSDVLSRRAWTASFAALVLLALVAAQPLGEPGWFMGHEGIYPLERVIALAHELRSGDWYPRWLSAGYYGKGIPFFNYYSPGFYLLVAYLYVFGLPLLAALKTACVLAFIGGAWGMFLWTRRHLGWGGGMVAAILYFFAPYHFVDLYVRAALSEFAALALLPYLFLGIDRTLERPAALAGPVLTGVAAAGIVLTHQLSALMILPFAAIYLLVRLYQKRLGRTGVVSCLAGGAIAVGLSAFYWLPVIAEWGHLKELEAAVTTKYSYYGLHFVTPLQWFATAWGFGKSVPGPEDGMSFQVGVLLVGGSVVALLALPWLARPVRRFAVLCAVLGGVGLWLTSASSSWVYELVPTYRYVQFPWRFLGPVTLSLAACGGASFALPALARFPRQRAAGGSASRGLAEKEAA